MAGSGTISSLGVGSNLDIEGIVTKLMAIERIPLNNLDTKKSSYDAKISGLGKINSALSTLQTSLDGLRYGTAFSATSVSSSNSSILTATGASGASAGTYSIAVSQLAQQQKLVATGQVDTTTAIGNGTLTIDLGTISGGTFDSVTGTYAGASYTSNGKGPYTVTIDSTNNSLAGIRDAINNANIGVSASIVNDGNPTNPYRLVLTSTSTGSDQSIKISVSGDAALSNLLSQDPTATQNLSETVTAKDAKFTVDGISVTKSSNTVSDVITGLSLNLSGVTSGTPVTLSVAQDTNSIKSAIQSFVSAYNSVATEIKKQTDVGAPGTTPGPLAGDIGTRQMLSSLVSEITTAVTSVSGSYKTLSSIGISFQKDGTLSLDSTQLDTALQADSSNVEQLFTATTDGYGTRIGNKLATILGANGTLSLRTDSINSAISSLENDRLKLESSLARTEKRLRSQFTALDVSIGQMNVTSSYLSQQIAGLYKA